jgi:colanic acid biosynthesis protein WcaH
MNDMQLGPEKIPTELYEQIYRSVPIFCVDIIAVDDQKRFLMVKRKNKPFEGTWWFPGGRVLKNETVHDAALRKLKEETGSAGTFVREVGFYELIDEDGYFENTTVHTPVVVCLMKVDATSNIQLDEQGSEYRWDTKIDPNLNPHVREMLVKAGFD